MYRPRGVLLHHHAERVFAEDYGGTGDVPADVKADVTLTQMNPTRNPSYLGAFTPSAGAPLLEAFRQGMRYLGYVEGQNIFIDYRWAEGTPSQ